MIKYPNRRRDWNKYEGLVTWVYVMRKTDTIAPVKIGMSHDPRQRLISVQGGSKQPPVELVFAFAFPDRATARFIEEAAHIRLETRCCNPRRYGKIIEWFNIEADHAAWVIRDIARRNRLKWLPLDVNVLQVDLVRGESAPCPEMPKKMTA